MKSQIIFLGTGDALVTHCYNTCFVIRTPEDSLLVDAGGGNGILSQLEKAQIQVNSLHHFFITHAHTDHILGAVWVVRMVMMNINKGNYEGEFHLYGHDKVIQVVDTICRMTLKSKDLQHLGKRVLLHTLQSGDRMNLAGMDWQCFDLFSPKEKQFGFRAVLPDGQVLVCLGDEPYNEQVRELAENADWLMHEAFCLDADKDIYKPYEKNHSTALDAACNAVHLHAARLIMYHTEDHSLATRKATYTAEAARLFTGPVFVPDDLEIIELNK